MLRSSINAVHARWADLHPLIRVLMGMAALAALGMVVLKPGYRAFKQWRMEKNLVEARKAVGEQRMGEARDLSLSVLQAGNQGIEAYRILEKSMASLRDPRHADVVRALLSHPQGSDQDRLTGFLSIAKNAPLGLVGQAWVMLQPDCQKNPSFAVGFAERLITEQRLGEAASVLVSVPEEMRTGAGNRCLIRVLIGGGKREGYDEAQRRIVAGMLNAPPSEIPDWLDLLEGIPAESLRGQGSDSIRQMLEKPANIDPARASLMLSRIDYATQYARRAEVLDTAVAKWKDAAPELLARFLSQIGLHQRLLDTFPVEQVKDHPGLFPLVLDALEKTDAWEAVLPFLDAHGQMLSKAENLAHHALAFSKTGKSAEFTQAWAAAIDEAKSDPQAEMLLQLHRLAKNAGMSAEADLALVDAIQGGRGPLPLYAEIKPLLASLQQQNRENTILEICAIYLQFEPGNPVLLTQYAYLACLNQLATPATILKAMSPLAEAFPKEVPIQFVLATIYLCDGQNDKAMATLDALNLDADSLPPAYRATLLTTQVLNGKLDKKDPTVTGFPWLSLLPSERRKFSELIRSVEGE